ncbi:MAG: hypothetical protein JXB26_17650 [Candidatus Aminicenantes bacterium]|nr:hypothetical protein [Candidatus Aminicenantes bacterium]
MHISKRLLPVISTVLLILILATLFVFRKERYILNRAVRLFCERLIQFEHLSMVRQEKYRFDIQSGYYNIYLFEKEKGQWKIFDRFDLPSSVVFAASDLKILLSGGGVESCLVDGTALEPDSYVILTFRHQKKPGKRKSVIFYEKGNWRVLDQEQEAKE